MPESGLIDWLSNLLGGAATTMIGAIMGRLMWHSGEVKKGRRRFFGRELFWEIPVAIGMAIIGEAAASYLEFGQPISTGIVAMLAYLGPRGFEALFTKLIVKGR